MGLADRFKEQFNNRTNLLQQTNSELADENKNGILIDQLKSNALNKILKTPYWQEYPVCSKINMIEKYLNAKIKQKSVQISTSDKKEFIDGVLAAAG